MWNPGYPPQGGLPPQGMPMMAPGMPMPGMYPPQMMPGTVVPPAAGPEVPKEERTAKLVPTTFNATYNLNSILAGTITSSDYFLSLLAEYNTFESVVEVIRDECTHLEAFEPGKAHHPSTAFCCMYKLFMMKLDVQQMNFMLRHKNVYVRGVALLYLRNIGEPSQLLGWCEPHLEDDTVFSPMTNPEDKTTLGKWLLNMLVDHRYCGTVLRRIPVPVVREVERKGLEIEIKWERAERIRKFLRKGVQCRAKWTDGIVYDAVIDEVLEDGTFLVTYPQYGNQEAIPITNFETESVPKGEEKRDEDRSSRDRDEGRGSRDRDRDGKRRRSRSRSRDRDRRKRSRSASPAREMTLEEEVELRLKRKRDSERSNAVSSDGKYCAQIVSYKKSLSKQFKGGTTFETTNKKLDLPDAHPRGSSERRRDRSKERRRSPSPEYRKKPELTQEQKQKRMELLSRYGDASNTKAGQQQRPA